MSKSVYNKNIEPKCELCVHAVTAADGSAILCPKKGIREFNDVCRRFRYDPLKRIPARPAERVTFSDLDFKL